MAAFLFAGGLPHVAASDARIWTSRKGTTLEAELLKVDPVNATLVTKDAKQIVLKVEDLSLADRQYLVEYGGADPSVLVSGDMGAPEKQVRIDSSTFKKLKDQKLKLGDDSRLAFELLETEHFLIGTAGGVRPNGVAETAERLWHGMAFQHMNFRRDWEGNRMVILLVEDRDAYTALGNWWTNQIKDNGRDEEAGKVAASWPQTGSSSIQLPEEVRSERSLLPSAIVFNVKEDSMFRKAMGPFQIHVISGALLAKQMGGVSSYGAEGYFAMYQGHAFYKEISLAGKSETQLLQVKGTDNEIGSKKGFEDGTSWARELRSLMRKGDIKAEVEPMFKWTMDELTPERLVLIYSFAYYMQSTAQRANSFAAMIRRIESSNQIPAPIEIAKLFGFETVDALEADWTSFIKEGNFK